jgi:hypothetical protein
MKRKIIALLIFYLLLGLLNINTVSSDIYGDHGLSSWTYMIYFVGDSPSPEPNDVAWMIPAINSLESIGSTPDVNILIQADDYNIWNNETRRYYITKDFDLYTISSSCSEDVTEKNMGDPQTLTDFINWATDNYPAEHYSLMIFSHGTGWGGICYDYSSKTTPIITESRNAFIDIVELDDALSHCSNFDILFLWACSMGQIEVIYQLQNHADIIIASESSVSYCEKTIKGPVENLTLNPSLTSTQLAQKIVNSYTLGNEEGPKTHYGIKTDSLENIKDSVNNLAEAIISSYNDSLENPELESPKKLIKDAFESSKIGYAPNTDFNDIWSHELYEFAKYLTDPALSSSFPSIRNSALNVLDAIDNAEIIKPETVEENLHGIAIYSPITNLIFSYNLKYYKQTKFADHTKWDELLNQYYKLAKNNPSEDEEEDSKYVERYSQKILNKIFFSFKRMSKILIFINNLKHILSEKIKMLPS